MADEASAEAEASETKQPSFRSGCLWLVVGFSALVGVTIFVSSGGDDEDPDDGEVTVTDVRKADADERYSLAGDLTAVNDSGEGWLRLPVVLHGGGNRSPLLEATVHYTGTLSELNLTCETPRSWLVDSGPTTLDLECASLVFLDSIDHVTVTANR